MSLSQSGRQFQVSRWRLDTLNLKGSWSYIWLGTEIFVWIWPNDPCEAPDGGLCKFNLSPGLGPDCKFEKWWLPLRNSFSLHSLPLSTSRLWHSQRRFGFWATELTKGRKTGGLEFLKRKLCLKLILSSSGPSQLELGQIRSGPSLVQLKAQRTGPGLYTKM